METQSTALAVRGEQQALAQQQKDAQVQALERLIVDGDMSRLSPQQRISYYYMRCEAAGIDAEAQPFEYLSLQGKLVLYAKKTCTDQLIAKKKLTVQIVSRVVVEDLCEVIAKVTRADGSSVEDIGVVPIGNLKGEQRANAQMKAVTKAKRRAVLSACGLGMMDENEVDSVQGAKRVSLLEAHADPSSAVRRWVEQFGRSATLAEQLLLEKQAQKELNPEGLPDALRKQVRGAIEQARQRLGHSRGREVPAGQPPAKAPALQVEATPAAVPATAAEEDARVAEEAELLREESEKAGPGWQGGDEP